MEESKRPEEIYAISGYVLNDSGDIGYLRIIKLGLERFYEYKQVDSVYIPLEDMNEFLSDGKELAYNEMPSDEFIRSLPRFSIAGRVLVRY